MWYVSCLNVPGAFINLKGIKSNRTGPKRKRNVVFSFQPSDSLICQYPEKRYKVLKNRAKRRSSKSSCIFGMGYLSPFIRQLKTRYYTLNLGCPTFVDTNTSEDHSNVAGTIKPAFNIFCNSTKRILLCFVDCLLRLGHKVAPIFNSKCCLIGA